MLFIRKKVKDVENSEIRKWFNEVLMERKSAYDKLDELNDILEKIRIEGRKANENMADEIRSYRDQLLHKVISKNR